MPAITLGDDALGKRYDVALVAALEDAGHHCTRSQLHRAFAQGGVRIAGKPIKPGWIVQNKGNVQVELPKSPFETSVVPEEIALDLVHEDAELLVINKPAGMVVHPSPGHASGTLVAGVLHHLGAQAEELPILPGNDETRPGIVHRLDKDTSGLLVVAKTAAAQAFLAKQFAGHSIERRYVAVVAGNVPFDVRRIETAHGRDPRDRRRFAAVETGRRAVTHVRVQEHLSKATQVSCELETGRTHQIRMHMKHCGHPVLGDALYGQPPRDPALRALWKDLKRLALHAEVLGFQHPRGDNLRFTSPLPAELEVLLTTLRQQD